MYLNIKHFILNSFKSGSILQNRFSQNQNLSAQNRTYTKSPKTEGEVSDMFRTFIRIVHILG